MVPFARSEHIFYDIDCVLQEIVNNQKNTSTNQNTHAIFLNVLDFEQLIPEERARGTLERKNENRKKPKYYIGDTVKDILLAYILFPRKI